MPTITVKEVSGIPTGQQLVAMLSCSIAIFDWNASLKRPLFKVLTMRKENFDKLLPGWTKCEEAISAPVDQFVNQFNVRLQKKEILLQLKEMYGEENVIEG